MRKLNKFISPAKLNLYLEVNSKRKDGFHNLESLMTFCELCDVIKIEKSKSFELKIQKTDYKDGFLRYEKYTRRDIHRILNWPKEPNHQSVGGYMSSPDKQNCLIFVKYKKDEKIADTMKYEDKFINNFTLEWYSKNSRTLKSGDVIDIIESSQNNMRLPLFLKKDDNEGLDFYFLGDLKVDKSFLEETFIIDKKNDKKKAIVKMRMHLDKPIKEDLYRYIIDQS